MYGGAAGGGKSSSLLSASLQFVHTTENYSALLLRKTYSDLTQPGALIPRSFAWLGSTDAQWKGAEHSWTFPKTGSVLKFGYLDTALDIYQYQSSEYQFIGFDEASQFRENDYRYLFSRLRKPMTMNVPLRMRSASNPGGIGHEWVKRRFITEGKQNGRWFIPATLDDNPHIDRQAYIQSLSNLDPVTRAQLLRGDWSARQGGRIFRREWFGVPMREVPEGLNWCRFWDMAATPEGKGDPDWTAGALVAVQNGVWWIRNIRHFRGTPKENEDIVKQTAALDGHFTMIRMEEEPGASGKSMVDHYRRSVLIGYNFDGVSPKKKKLLRAGPFSSAAEAGNVRLIEGSWIGDFLDEVEAFTGDGKEHDDQVDAVTGAMAALTTDTQNPVTVGYAEPSIESDRLSRSDFG